MSTFGKCRGLEEIVKGVFWSVFRGLKNIIYIDHSTQSIQTYFLFKTKKIACLIISSNSLIMLILKYMQRALWLWSIGNLFCVSKAHGFDGCDRDSAKQMPATYDVLFFTSSAELKMELLREKEMREGLEKQLSEEQKNKGRYLQHNSKQYKLLYHLG